jgi:hypothetical protein
MPGELHQFAYRPVAAIVFEGHEPPALHREEALPVTGC